MSAGSLPPVAPPEVVEALGAEPTDEQWRAISMPLEPYVVVAGAGSGKTSVMAARVVYLALVALGRVEAGHPGVLPGDVLCLTFTNKATENLLLRIRRALSAVALPEGEEPTILNYHGFAAQILDRYGLRLGIEPGQRVLSVAQRTELCARVLDEMAFRHVKSDWQPTLVENILTLGDQAANHRVDPERIIEFNRNRLQELERVRANRTKQASLERIELAEALQRFRRLKREHGVIDFGDQITLALDIVERFPDAVEEYRTRYRAVVLDEYQDTDVAQAALIATVFGGGFPVTAVGDPDQNIYSWRGASLYNLLEFPTTFPRADGSPAPRLPLYTNFRSGSRILAAADRVMVPMPAAQRPDPEKRLVPWPPNGEGSVELRRLSDEWSEAGWIADRIVSLHAEDPVANPWSSFAVLCRKSRLFAPLQEAFAERGVPAEIIGLAGLLSLPEVVEVLAYARAVAHPEAGVPIARILLGPRYRVGFKDLARVGAWAKDRNHLRRDEDADEDTPAFLFSEAMEHLEEVTGLSDEGRRRLGEFRAELAGLRAEARRPVGDFLAHVIRRSGLLDELDASPDPDRALATRRNLSAFLDQVHGFSPLEGELTLRAFLDYVDLVQAADKPEWSPVQPSGEDTVKVMTIHQAKGLEFDHVFVPGVAKGLLPDNTVTHNPAEKGKSLDFELRGDAAILPRFDGVLTSFWKDLRDEEEREERRAFYVAVTRARRRLWVTSAHWYGDEVQKPKDRSRFFEELVEWGTETGLASVDTGAEPGDENPLHGYRERFVRDWPGPALRTEPDALFPGGWRQAAMEAAAVPEAERSLDAVLGPADRDRYAAASRELRTVAAHLIERERSAPAAAALPATVSVGGVIDYARCPKRFYWSAVRPLPRFSGPAARIGTQVHAWIERRSSGQTSLLELEEEPDLTAEEVAGEPGRIERLQRAFTESRFGDQVPLYAERPFLLRLDGFTVSGRIDAVFGAAEGPWEVVDYKTGKIPDRDDPLAHLQLDLYALACSEVWHKDPAEVTLTYLYLGSETELSWPAGDPEETRRRALDALRSMAAGEFGPTPGSQCRWCDFLSFCDAGRGYVAASGGGGAPADAGG